MRRRTLLIAVPAATAAGTASMRPLRSFATQPTPVTHIVEIRQFDFSPRELVVRKGDIVTWVNRDIAPHTATATDSSWDTGELAQGESADIVVRDDMQASYYCRYHPMMKGQLTIRRH